MAKWQKRVASFSNDGSPGPMTKGHSIVDDGFEVLFWLMTHDLWRVCWSGDTEDDGFVTHYGPPVQRKEAIRRIDWGMKKYPHLIYWLEKVA